jgi:CRISPR-associated exonuclease Cas4
MLEFSGLTVSVVIIIIAVAGLLLLRARIMQEESGLPQGQVIYSDTGTWFRNEEPLHSTESRLVGKPDYLVHQENGEIIPVEIKSGKAPPSPWPGHILQLISYCRMVDDVYGVRPSYGILQYSDDAFTVEYTAELEADLLNLMQEMRCDHQEDEINRSHDVTLRCQACGFKEKCVQRLA